MGTSEDQFWDRLKSQWNKSSNGAAWDIGEFWRRIPFFFIERDNEFRLVPLGFATPDELYAKEELSSLLSKIINHGEYKPSDFASAGDFLAYHYIPPQLFLKSILDSGLQSGFAYNKHTKKIHKNYRFVAIPKSVNIESSNPYLDLVSFCNTDLSAESFTLLRPSYFPSKKENQVNKTINSSRERIKFFLQGIMLFSLGLFGGIISGEVTQFTANSPFFGFLDNFVILRRGGSLSNLVVYPILILSILTLFAGWIMIVASMHLVTRILMIYTFTKLMPPRSEVSVNRKILTLLISITFSVPVVIILGILTFIPLGFYVILFVTFGQNILLLFGIIIEIFTVYKLYGIGIGEITTKGIEKKSIHLISDPKLDLRNQIVWVEGDEIAARDLKGGMKVIHRPSGVTFLIQSIKIKERTVVIRYSTINKSSGYDIFKLDKKFTYLE